MGRAKEAIITHLDKALGQDMLKKAVNESPGGQRAELGLAGVGVVAEGDLVILDLDDAAIAEGNAKDVGGEILEGRAAIADGLAVDDPVLLPHGSGDVGKAIGLAQGVPELGSNKLGQRLDGEQEHFLRGQPGLPIFSQTTRRDEVMHVRMVGQVTRPGVQNADQAECAADETRVPRQLLSRLRRGAKENIIHELLVTACEGTQLAG